MILVSIDGLMPEAVPTMPIVARMAAEGAVAAYEHVVGEAWKPFERPVDNPGHTVDRKAAELQMATLG